MHVLRLERADGLGVYARDDFGAVLAECFKFGNADMWARHPEPSRDRLLGEPWLAHYNRNIHRQFKFGFLNETQLERYVIGEKVMRALGRRGIMLSLYGVSDFDVLPGETQCAFRAHAATLINRKNAGEYQWQRLA